MKTYTITTVSDSVYKIEEHDDGRFTFGAIETPNSPVGTRFLGATHDIEEPEPWPVTVGDRFAVFAFVPETFPASGGWLVTSPVKSILIRESEVERAIEEDDGDEFYVEPGSGEVSA